MRIQYPSVDRALRRIERSQSAQLKREVTRLNRQLIKVVPLRFKDISPGTDDTRGPGSCPYGWPCVNPDCQYH